MRRRSNPGVALTLGLAVAGCAAGTGPAEPMPQQVELAVVEVAAGPAHLQPSAGALSAAETAELSGIELGTMWTFENPPVEQWRQRYGFEATPEWLEHVRLSSVRYARWCSASFVSPDGLVMTNHHCARGCTEAVSTPDTDYVEEGFYAATREEERLCPGVFLDQLVEIEDVTARVQGAAPMGAAPAEVAAAMEAEREAIVDGCEAETGYECQVVSLFHGGQYQLYRFRRFQPVKLVFVPELQAGFYGGDPDNFTYPRWALDVTFVRAYEADGETPASTPQHFGWDPAGADEGELVFVTGNPGSTSRQATVAQLLYEQQARHPFIVDFLAAQRAHLLAIAARGPEAERSVRDQLFGIENSLKLYRGQLEGLRDTLLMGQKIRWEREFQDRVMADAELRRQYGTVWDSIATIAAQRAELYAPFSLANAGFMGFPHQVLVRDMIRFARQMELPEAERDSAYRADVVAETRDALLSRELPPMAHVRPLFRSRLELMRDWLDESDPLRMAFLGWNSVDEAAGMLDRSRCGERAFREELLDGGLAAFRTSSDPLVEAVFVMDNVYGTLSEEWSGLVAALTVQEERLAKALFAVFGTDLPPDATFTLRITDGVVARYPYNGTFAAPFTTYYGLYDRAAAFSNEMPWTLPATFAERADAVDMSARLNFVTTNDITGGNSGSPMIDREGRVVGIAFDGNVEQLPNEFLFRDDAGRTVGVSSQGITEALRSVYRAEALMRELLGSIRP